MSIATGAAPALIKRRSLRCARTGQDAGDLFRESNSTFQFAYKQICAIAIDGDLIQSGNNNDGQVRMHCSDQPGVFWRSGALDNPVTTKLSSCHLPKHILSVSYDPSLLSTREMLLSRRGYRVTSALGFTAALDACKASDFDLFILGHSIPQNDKKHLVAAFRAKCNSPVLALQRYGEEGLVGVDAHVYPDDIESLFAIVQTMLKNPEKDEKKN